MTALKMLGNAMWLIGLLATVFGLWCVAGGLRVVVSRRPEERERSSLSAKIGVPFVVGGVVLLFAGMWLANN
jgi:hypothetical protein